MAVKRGEEGQVPKGGRARIVLRCRRCGATFNEQRYRPRACPGCGITLTEDLIERTKQFPAKRDV